MNAKVDAGARRSLILGALGALFGLAIAGYGLFSAKGTRTSTVPSEDVALVNQVPLLMSDYLVQLRALYDVSLSEATATQKNKILDDMIREELYVQRGVELGLQSDTLEVRSALVGAVEAQIVTEVTMAQPPESELRSYYDDHPAKYASEGMMELDDFLVARDRSAGAVAALRQHADMPPFGLVRTAAMTHGEEFYFAAKVHLGDTLFDVAKALRSGEVSEPVIGADGIHILLMKMNHAPVLRPYADVRDAVVRDVIDEQSKILGAGNEHFLRKRADILLQRGFE